MIWLALSILSSTVLIFLFRLFPKYKIHTFQAIVFNYIVATSIGLFTLPQVDEVIQGININWLILAIILGVIFISLFFLIAITAQRSGITIATVSMKLGMIAPVIIGIFFFGESKSLLKFLAVFLSIIAVVLISYKPNAGLEKENKRLVLLLPIIVFLGSGLSDSIVQFAERVYFPQGGFEAFIILVFGTAGLIGFAMLIVQLLKGKIRFSIQNILAGVILGVPNYGSIYFFFKTLNESGFDSSLVFPINNIGIVSAASLGALVFFRERLNIYNFIGLLLTFIVLILISWV